MTEKTKHDSLAAALAAAQAEMGNAPKTATGNFGHYADLPSLRDAVIPVLSAHGIAVVQLVEGDGSCVSVTTRLLWGSESMDCGSLTMPITGARGNVNHSIGSAVTYARRYTLGGAVCDSAHEDDDAESLGGTVPRDWVSILKGVLREEIKAEGRKEVEACIRYATGYRLGVEDVGEHAKEILAALDAAKKDGGGSFAGFKSTAINQWNKE